MPWVLARNQKCHSIQFAIFGWTHPWHPALLQISFSGLHPTGNLFHGLEEIVQFDG
ncbi:MAG: hypothetical protein RLZZ488_1214 [Pseudomonadota bacterium]|jgi:hypothetical protein